MEYEVRNFAGTTFSSPSVVVWDAIGVDEAVRWVAAIVANNDVTRITGCIGLDLAIAYINRDGVEHMWYFEATDDYVDGTAMYGNHAIV